MAYEEKSHTRKLRNSYIKVGKKKKFNSSKTNKCLNNIS